MTTTEYTITNGYAEITVTSYRHGGDLTVMELAADAIHDIWDNETPWGSAALIVSAEANDPYDEESEPGETGPETTYAWDLTIRVVTDPMPSFNEFGNRYAYAYGWLAGSVAAQNYDADTMRAVVRRLDELIAR